MLYIGDVEGILAYDPQTMEWTNLGDTEPLLQQEFSAVVFDSEGTPYLGSKRGLLRGGGPLPWRWEVLFDRAPVRLVATGADQRLFLVLGDDQAQEIGCFAAQGDRAGTFRHLPITNWFLHWMVPREITALVAHPTRPDRFYFADNFGAVYAGSCGARPYKIGQRSAPSVPSSLAIGRGADRELYLLWASRLGLVQHQID